MKVSKLTGAHLDYWVARADGREADLDPLTDEERAIDERWIVWYDRNGLRGGTEPASNYGSPSTNWAIGGPIIERERVVTFPDGQGGWAAFVQGNPTCAYVDTTALDEILGPTLLIAAMRAYVASKFGDEVSDSVA